MLNVEVKNLRLTGSFVAIVLAMALLGPAPAAALAAACALLDAAVSRKAADKKLVNIATFTTFALLGGLAIAVLAGDFDPTVRRSALVRRRRVRHVHGRQRPQLRS